MAQPAVTVLMPAYNAEQYIAVAIESILNQSFDNFEFVVIDDCSTDATWQIIQNYTTDKRIVATRNEVNLNIANTLNRGIHIAQGKYIARMDNDDWSYPDRLAKQYRYMEDNPQVVVSGGTIEICSDNLAVFNKRRYNVTDDAIKRKIFQYSPFCHPATIYRTDIAKSINGYNPDLAYAEDYDFYFRLGKYGKFGNLNDTILKLRTHRGSMSQSKGRHQEILTLFIRLKAIYEYGYRMTLSDKIYFAGQYMSTVLIPYRFKFWLFNFLRSMK